MHLPLKQLLALPEYLAQFCEFEKFFSPSILISKKFSVNLQKLLRNYSQDLTTHLKPQTSGGDDAEVTD